MAVWIIAWCTADLGSLTLADVSRAMANFDYGAMAEAHGLPDGAGEAARQALRLEGDTDEFTEARLFYGREDSASYTSAWCVPVSRWRGELAEASAKEKLDWQLPPNATRVRDVLARCAEEVSFCLKGSDAGAMGWPICWHTAMWLAERGAGLVQAGEQWWDPATYKRVG